MIRALVLGEVHENGLVRALGCRPTAQVLVVSRGAEALARAAAEPPDLLIAPWSTLRAERYALLLDWKASQALRGVPFLILVDTAREPEEERLARQLGADGFVAPCADPDELMARCSEIVSAARARALEGAAAENERVRDLEAKIARLERAAAEVQDKDAQVRMALRAARMGTWIWDAEHDKLSWAIGHEQPIWETQPESFDGALTDFLAIIHPEDRAAQQAAVRNALETRSDYEYEYRMVYPGDNVRWVAAWGRPFYDAENRPLRMIGVYMDITERRHREEQVRQAQKMEAIGLLAGGIAHDFNNILSAIIGNAGLARRDMGAGHAASQSLDEIDRAAQRARSLVQQILAFGRKQPVEKRVVSLSDVIEETCRLLRATLPGGVTLTTLCADDAPHVLADPTQLQQVMLNLSTNAWHALGDAPGSIVIELQPYPQGQQRAGAERVVRGRLEEGRYARIAVSDTGPGMEQSTLARIFEPFFTTKSPGHGTGLGLWVVDDIVKSHGGAIGVISQRGVGSTFEVYLPASEVLEVAASGSEPPRSLAPRVAGEHVLYIDDEELLVRLAKRMLEPLGYHVHGFTRAGRALAAFRSDPGLFHLAITDLAMPDANGLDVASQLRALRPDMPIILSSGFLSDELRQRARDLGVVQILQKPVRVQQFCSEVRRALQKGLQPA